MNVCVEKAQAAHQLRSQLSSTDTPDSPLACSRRSSSLVAVKGPYTVNLTCCVCR